MELVERDNKLGELRRCLQAAASRGHVVMLSGEAGIGKTSLLRALAASAPDRWWGACDALDTPHPLGPLLDIARDATPAFAAHLAGPRLALFEAVLDELRLGPAPRLVVIEDAHWADDATLDLLKFLARRIERTRALLVISFRDDELAAGHRLRQLIGDVPSSALTRIELDRLSPAAVETLARRALRSPAGLFAATQGNPFFVTELLRHGVAEVPRTVQDLVLARFARLARPAQAIVRLASILPGGLDTWLLQALLAPALPDLEACLDAGLLVDDGDVLRFRHELARNAVQSALPPTIAVALHAQVLRCLLADGRSVAPARLAHHASLARDAQALRQHAPAAAAQALARGANREAAGHLRAVLALPEAAADPERPRWLEDFAEACQRIDANQDAIAAREALATLHRAAADTRAEAYNLCRLAMLYVRMMRNADADDASRRAIALLEPLPHGAELAVAYDTEAALRMLNRDCEDSVAWSRQAIALARELGDDAQLCKCLSTHGTAAMFIDFDDGRQQMEAVVRMALDLGLEATAANAMLNLGSAAGELMRFDVAETWLRQAADYARERELDTSARYVTAWLALCALELGRWQEAGELAGDALAHAGLSTITRLMALVALGRLRLRRGDPGAAEVLDDALRHCGDTQTLQRAAPLRAARAEAAHARGDLVATNTEAQAALTLAIAHRHPWFIGELAYWCWRAGGLAAAPAGCAAPYALQIAGAWREAADAWQQLGCPFEQARALADGDEAARRTALTLFEQLGARPAADALRRSLRDAGVRGVARGARASTRERAFGLTTRELQVLTLLCAGLRNAEIAARLSRSVRTVDHHVAAAFAKLGVDSRVAAIQAAQRAGLVAQSGQDPAPN